MVCGLVFRRFSSTRTLSHCCNSNGSAHIRGLCTLPNPRGKERMGENSLACFAIGRTGIAFRVAQQSVHRNVFRTLPLVSGVYHFVSMNRLHFVPLCHTLPESPPRCRHMSYDKNARKVLRNSFLAHESSTCCPSSTMR